MVAAVVAAEEGRGVQNGIKSVDRSVFVRVTLMTSYYYMCAL
jgi:hypothetical protein